jgi:hypothetical protein
VTIVEVGHNVGMKYRVIIAAVVALAVGALVAVILTARTPGVSFASFEGVHEGMTREDVHNAVGVPPGDYSARKLANNSNCALPSLDFWVADDGLLQVFYGPDGRAEGVYRSQIEEPSRWNRFRARLGI